MLSLYLLTFYASLYEISLFSQDDFENAKIDIEAGCANNPFEMSSP